MGYNEEQFMSKVIEKLMKNPRVRDRNGRWYFFRRLYPHHVLMSTEFGYKTCFKYSEVYAMMFS